MIFNFKNLYRAFLDCRQGKRGTKNCLYFEYNLEKELVALEKELQTKKYHPGRSICFVVEKPKLREIFAADFRDRVIHHLLYAYLNPIFEPIFIFHSFACRKGKGTHRAAFFLQKMLKATQRQNLFYLKADVSSFFVHINHDLLLAEIKRQIKNPDIIWLTEKIIRSHPTDCFTKRGNFSLFAKVPYHKSLFNVPKNCGLPIGNLTSQFFANVYLNRMDQYIKHNLKVNAYVRYVDDFILLADSPKKLVFLREQINDFLKRELKLQLHPKKQVIGTTAYGIDFVGYLVKPTHIVPRKRVIGNLLHAIREYCRTLPESPSREELEKILASINGYFAHLVQASTLRLRKSIWQNEFGRLREYIRPAKPGFEYFRLKQPRDEEV